MTSLTFIRFIKQLLLPFLEVPRNRSLQVTVVFLEYLVADLLYVAALVVVMHFVLADITSDAAALPTKHAIQLSVLAVPAQVVSQLDETTKWTEFAHFVRTGQAGVVARALVVAIEVGNREGLWRRKGLGGRRRGGTLRRFFSLLVLAGSLFFLARVGADVIFLRLFGSSRTCGGDGVSTLLVPIRNKVSLRSANTATSIFANLTWRFTPDLNDILRAFIRFKQLLPLQVALSTTSSGSLPDLVSALVHVLFLYLNGIFRIYNAVF